VQASTKVGGYRLTIKDNKMQDENKCFIENTSCNYFLNKQLLWQLESFLFFLQPLQLPFVIRFIKNTTAKTIMLIISKF
jgi:hypothetical protein